MELDLLNSPLVQAGLAAVVALVILLVASRRPKNAPPNVRKGLPIIGNFIEFAKGPMNFMNACYAEYGSVFTMGMPGCHLTFLIGPEAGECFFAAEDDVMSQTEVYGFVRPVFGPDVVYDAPLNVRRQQMAKMSQGLRKARLVSYVPKIVRETVDFVKEWGSDGQLDILQSLSDLTILTASRCLHGDDVRENMFKEVSHLYHDLDQGITPLSFFLPYIPIPAHMKRDRARKEMVALFSKVISARREDPEGNKDNTDLLQVFIDMAYKDGSKNTNDQITGLLIALLFAGQHTSSITSTWTTLFLAHHPDILRRVVAELDAKWPRGEELTFEHVQSFDLLHNCVKEALRMHPPLIMLMRKVKQDVECKSHDGKRYTLPKGDIVVTSPAVSHRLDYVFSEPNRFDPDRYDAPREEDKQEAFPFAYLGFGAGNHSCMGERFGLMQVKTIVATIVRNFDIEPVGELPGADYTAMVVGPLGQPQIKYRRKA